MNHAMELRKILQGDRWRYRLLEHVRSLDLPDCWVGAGFVRNAVRDSCHGRPPARPAGDVDVLWFHPQRSDREIERLHEEALRRLNPTVDWSVKNQARMHERNGDAAYVCAVDAMRHWPETATAVAVRLAGEVG